MTQKTKAANLLKFEAGDRPTDQDFIDLFDSILFLNNEGIHDNGLSSNDTTILGNLNIGGNLDIQGAGNILIEGSFSAGNVSAGVAGGRISAFTSIDSPPFYASSSISEVMFSGISSKTTSSIALTTKGSDELTSGDVRFGIENGKGFLDAQGTTIISYSTGSSATSGGDNIIHMSASVGIGTTSPSKKLHVYSTGNGEALIERASGAQILLQAQASVGVVGTNSNHDLDLKTNGSTRIKVENTGNVGINQPTPIEILDIVGNFRANGSGLFSGTSNPTLTINHTDSGKLIFNIPNGTAEATFTSETNATADDADFAFITNDGSGNINEIVRFKEDGKVGIGTDNPQEKLDIVGGHIQLESGYGLGRLIGSGVDEYIIYPYLTGMPTSFTNITAHGTIGNDGISLQSDRTINFIETDLNVLVGHMNLNEKRFDWDGVINAEKFKGDGSLLTGITGGQITGFVSTPGDNFLVTSNAAGDGVFGEANLTFDGSTLAFTSTTAPTNGYISFPLLDDTQGEIFRTALKFPSTDDRALLQYGTVANDDFELRLRLQDGNADKFVIISDATSDYRALDINGERALFFQDSSNSAGRVGIGTSGPTHLLSINTETVLGGTLGDETNLLSLQFETANTTNLLFTGLRTKTGTDWQTVGTRIQSKVDSTFQAYIQFNGDDENGSNNNNAGISFGGGSQTTSANDTVELMRIEADGNVGIGTSNPGAKLDVEGDIKIGSAITLFSAGVVASGPDIQFNGAGLIAAEAHLNLNINSNGGSDSLFIRSGGDTNADTELARFTSTGQLGIGGVDPGQKLTINGTTAESWDRGIGFKMDGTLYARIITDTDGIKHRTHVAGDHHYFRNSANENGLIVYDNRDIKAGQDVLATRNVAVGTGHLQHNNTSSRDKIRVWSNSSYCIGMQAGVTYGGLNDYAMTFQMNDEGDRGWWWGQTNHGVDEGAMALDTDGNLTIARGLRISSESDTTGPPTGISMTQAAGAATAGETRIGKGSGGALKIQSEFGYVQVGPQNAGHMHFSTDMDGFYFDNDIRVNTGLISSYDEDLKLRRDYNDTDYNEIVVTDGSVFFRLNNDIVFRVEGEDTWMDGKLWVGGTNYDHTGTTASPTIDLAIGDSNTGLDNGGENLLDFYTANSLRMRIDASGRVGIGGAPTSTNEYGDGDEGLLQITNGSRPAIEVKNGEGYPSGGAMVIYSDSEDTSYPLSNSSNGVFGQSNHGSAWWVGISGTSSYPSRNFLTFWDGEAGGWFNYGNSENITFTGQHYSKPSTGIASDYLDNIGHIVISTGVYDNFGGYTHQYGPNISEALPKVAISTQANDKRVFGVISKCEEGDIRVGGYSNLESTSTIKPNDHRLVINSIGEGAVIVSNINGNLENGDYITTSAIEGLGMKQDDDLLHNYTVAKITQDCDFTSDTTNVTHNGITYKSKLVGCTYHCG